MAPALTIPQADEAPLFESMKNSTQAETKLEVAENYDGDYRFAPIEEAQVSRAMIKRCDFPYQRNVHTLTDG
jgi:cysteine-dependent adenosine diphosphate thiazole synthase